MDLWSRAPTTLKTYVLLNLIWSIVAGILGGHLYAVAFVALDLLISYFLLKGVRWLWWALVLTSAISLPLVTLEGTAWYSVASDVISLLLLLHPDSRRHFFRPEARAAAAGAPSGTYG